MKLKEIIVSGRICILLKRIEPLDWIEYLDLLQDKYYESIHSPGFRFYSLYLLKDRKIDTYPMVSESDRNKLLNDSFYRKRFQRLQALSNNLYYYSIQLTDSDITGILEYSKLENMNRIIIFNSKNILQDENRLLKIWKMNSFCSFRERNIFYSSNLFNRNGYLTEKKISQILQGKARYSSQATLEKIPLELDREFDSNLIRIKFTKKAIEP